MSSACGDHGLALPPSSRRQPQADGLRTAGVLKLAQNSDSRRWRGLSSRRSGRVGDCQGPAPTAQSGRHSDTRSTSVALSARFNSGDPKIWSGRKYGWVYVCRGLCRSQYDFCMYHFHSNPPEAEAPDPAAPVYMGLPAAQFLLPRFWVALALACRCSGWPWVRWRRQL